MTVQTHSGIRWSRSSAGGPLDRIDYDVLQAASDEAGGLAVATYQHLRHHVAGRGETGQPRTCARLVGTNTTIASNRRDRHGSRKRLPTDPATVLSVASRESNALHGPHHE